MPHLDPTLVTALAIVAGSLTACAVFMLWCLCRAAAMADDLAAMRAGTVVNGDANRGE